MAFVASAPLAASTGLTAGGWALGGIGLAASLGMQIYGANQQASAEEDARGAMAAGQFGAAQTQQQTMGTILGLGEPYRQVGENVGLAGLQSLILGGDISQYFPSSGVPTGRTADQVATDIKSIENELAAQQSYLNAAIMKSQEHGGTSKSRRKRMAKYQTNIANYTKQLENLKKEQSQIPIRETISKMGGMDLSKVELGKDFQFMAGEMGRANEAKFSKMGLSSSGAAGEAYTRGYGNLLSNEVQNQFARKFQTLSTLAGYGTQAATGVAPTLAQVGGQQANLQFLGGQQTAEMLQKAGEQRSDLYSGLGQLPLDLANLYIQGKTAKVF